jgi:protein involved in polysaccharide export with SLBB domain
VSGNTTRQTCQLRRAVYVRCTHHVHARFGRSVFIRAVAVEEIDNKPVSIDTRGNISVLLVGRIHAAGLTTDGIETEIETRLKKYVNERDVFSTRKAAGG